MFDYYYYFPVTKILSAIKSDYCECPRMDVHILYNIGLIKFNIKIQWPAKSTWYILISDFILTTLIRRVILTCLSQYFGGSPRCIYNIICTAPYRFHCSSSPSMIKTQRYQNNVSGKRSKKLNNIYEHVATQCVLISTYLYL